jgi:hypothetical protein
MLATHVISTMMHKMISSALLFLPPLRAYFLLKGTAIMLMKEQNTLVRKGHL